MAPEPKVSILITAKDLATKVVDGVRAKLSSFAGGVKSVFASLNSVLGALGLAATGAALGKLFQTAMAEAAGAERAQLRLRDSVERVGLSYAQLEPQISAYVDAQAKAAALDDDDVATALATLITRSGDLSGSMEHLNATLGLAAKEHMDLQAAADIVGRAMNGNLRGLKQLGIESKDTTDALRQLREMYGGFAEQEAHTFEGMQRRLTVAWGNLLEAMGKVIAESPVIRSWMDDLSASAERASQQTNTLAGTFDTTLASLRSLGSAIKITLLVPLAVLATPVLAAASAFRMLLAALLQVGIAGGRALNLVIGGVNKLAELVARFGGQKAALMPLIPEGFFDSLERWREGNLDQVVKNGYEVANAWKAAGGAIGEALANASLADERAQTRAEGRPVVGKAGDRQSPSRPKGTRRGGGDADEEEKTQRKADQARTQEIAGLVDLLRLRQLNAAGVERLTVLQAQLAQAVEQERAAVERGQGSYARLAALEKQRQELASAVTKVLDEQHAKEIATLNILVDLRKIDGAGLARLLELQQWITAEVKKEADLVKQGLGDRERLVALLREQQELEERVGKVKPAKVQTGTLGPQEAPRIEISARDQAELQIPTPDDGLPEWLQRVREGYEGITTEIRKARGENVTFGDEILSVGGSSIRAFQNASLAAFSEIGNGTKSMGKAFSDAIRAGVADAAKAEGQYYFNLGVAALGEGLFGSPRGFAAAAKFFLASAGFMALGNLAGGGSGGRAGGGGGGGDTRQRSGLEQLGGGGRGKITLYMPDGASVFDPNDPRMVEAWRRMLADLTDRDVVVVGRGR